METQNTLKMENSTNVSTSSAINHDLIRFMHILSNNIDDTKTIMKGHEQKMAAAVKDADEKEMLFYQNKITDLIYDRMLLDEAANKMTSAIFSDIRNLDSNWWAVNKVIGNSTTGLIWGYSWSSEDQEAFINFINIISNDPESTFPKLATLLRSSEENTKKYYHDFVKYIEDIQNQMPLKMSRQLVDTLIEKSSFPCSEAELEILFDNLVEPKTW